MNKVGKTSLSKKCLPLALITAMGILGSQANAGGFQLFEFGANGLGDAGSGMTTMGDNPQNAFTNPASMTMAKGQEVTSSLIAIDLNTHFKGTSRWSTTNPLLAGAGQYVEHGKSHANGIFRGSCFSLCCANQSAFCRGY